MHRYVSYTASISDTQKNFHYATYFCRSLSKHSPSRSFDVFLDLFANPPAAPSTLIATTFLPFPPPGGAGASPNNSSPESLDRQEHGREAGPLEQGRAWPQEQGRGEEAWSQGEEACSRGEETWPQQRGRAWTPHLGWEGLQEQGRGEEAWQQSEEAWPHGREAELHDPGVESPVRVETPDEPSSHWRVAGSAVPEVTGLRSSW